MCWFTLPCVETVELASLVGFRCGVVDLEHTMITTETAQLQFMAMKGSQMVPLARLPENTPGNAKKVLDAGVMGIILPYVESVAEAKAAVQNVRYGPAGQRGMAAYAARAGKYGFDYQGYVERWDELGLLILMIESQKGADAAAEIASIDGVDGLFFGPNDFIYERGRVDIDGPETHAAFAAIRDAAKKAGKVFGGAPFGSMMPDKMVAEGADLIGLTSDVNALKMGWAPAIEAANTWAK
jgi:2-keto-3-deoxy-L-rhamnonate aldolase RhmA